jgi:predicted RNA-binding protein associated with RNAse of E/G family
MEIVRGGGRDLTDGLKGMNFIANGKHYAVMPIHTYFSSSS